MANTYRQCLTGRAAPGGSLGPGGVACSRMAASTPSATPSVAAGSSCGQEQLAAEALAASHSRKPRWYYVVLWSLSQLALRRLSSAPPAHTVPQANLYRSTDRTHKLRPASTYPATGLGPIRPWDR